MLPTYSPSAVLLLATLFLFTQNLFSQENRPFRHSNEIGVDFMQPFREQSGVNILYKHALGKTTDMEGKHRFALRLLLGYYDYAHDYSITLRQVGDTTFLLEGSGLIKHRFLNAGAEMQFRKKNFRFHLGAEAGYRRWNSLGRSQRLSRANGISIVTDPNEFESKANVAQASVLGGISYFFLPRFSVGMEANISAALEFSRTKTLQNGAVVRTDTGNLLEIDFRFIRLMYLSYHFGSTAKKPEPTR